MPAIMYGEHYTQNFIQNFFTFEMIEKEKEMAL